MKINTTLSHPRYHLDALLHSTPITAARHGVLGLVHDLLHTSGSPLAAQLHEATAELRGELGDVQSVYFIPEALRARVGRPPRRVIAMLRKPELVAVLCQAVDELDMGELYPWVAAWGPQTAGDVVPLSADAWTARGELVDALRARAAALIAHWEANGVLLRPESPAVDGRTLTAAARVWQVPMITGELPAAPEAMQARYPNRVGKAAAAVAYQRMTAAIMSLAPDEAVVEPVALLIAVGEAISVPGDRETARAVALRGRVPVSVRAPGDWVPEVSLSPAHWWPVFASWGSSVSREAQAVPTAWRLSDVEADVLVWALCSAAARLAVASSLVPQTERGARRVTWDEHRAVELPKWSAGARSVWELMQTTRGVERRSAWPGCVDPVLGDGASWPWRPAPSVSPGTVSGVPDTVEV